MHAGGILLRIYSAMVADENYGGHQVCILLEGLDLLTSELSFAAD